MEEHDPTSLSLSSERLQVFLVADAEDRWSGDGGGAARDLSLRISGGLGLKAGLGKFCCKSGKGVLDILSGSLPVTCSVAQDFLQMK